MVNKLNKQTGHYRFTAAIIMAVIFSMASCKKYVTVDPPTANVSGASVFTNEKTAAAVLTNIYAGMAQQNTAIRGQGLTCLSLMGSLLADELTLFDLNDPKLSPYYTNDLTTASPYNFWNTVYPDLFVVNAAIEGLNSSGITPVIKQQLLGEAYFLRGFFYYYLQNLYGDVPLVTTTNYKINAVMPRTASEKVYEQVIADLLMAKQLLSEEFLDAYAYNPDANRVRPTRWAATALLARVYLTTGKYAEAIAEASIVINNTARFKLKPLNDVFKMNSDEAIWQLQPVGAGLFANTGEGALFILPANGPNILYNPVYLSRQFIGSFEATDQRKSNWTDTVITSSDTFYFAYKYKIGQVSSATKEYIMVLRLAEQFLIRAEAYAQLGKTTEAATDLNAIRQRAGLSPTSAATPQELLTAILHERKVELFTEWGHRWFDLKRTNSLDAVMSTATAAKGGTWQPTSGVFPIPQEEIERNPNMVQNPGYF